MSVMLFIPFVLIYPRPGFVAIYKLVIVYIVLSAVLVLSASLQAFYEKSSVLSRQRAKVIILGAGLGFPLPALALYLSLFGGALSGWKILTNFSMIPIVVFPATIAFAISKHNLFDVDLYIKRAVGYGIMTAIVGVGYISLQTLMTTVISSPIFGEFAAQS